MKLVMMVCLFFTSALSAGESSGLRLSSSELAELSKLYDLTAEESEQRLVSEISAINLSGAIPANLFSGYSGRWFDGVSGSLVIATTDLEDVELIERLGALPVLVDHDLDSLHGARSQVIDRLLAMDLVTERFVVESSINVMTNSIEVHVLTEYADAARNALREMESDVRIDVVERDGFPVISSGVFRGGEGAQNLTWNDIYSPDLHPCTIGPAVYNNSTYEAGFAWAGHCGFTTIAGAPPQPDNAIGTAAFNPLGTVRASDRTPLTTNAPDKAWVATGPGWSPTAQIQAYSSGVINIPAQWSGNRPALIGTTVCRVGQTSGGPHCGQLAAINVDANFYQYGIYKNVNRVSGACTLPGDSGGPWYSLGSNQIQGTNSGGNDWPSCASPGWTAYYTPITGHIANYNLTMYTSHGFANPTPVSLVCPDYGSSGSGQFFCRTSYSSQGATTVSWVRNGSTTFSESLFGSCSSGSTVNITLNLTNSYGSTSQGISFPCPTGPIP